VDPAFSLAPVAHRLGELLGTPVTLAEDTVGEGARSAAQELQDGQVLVLENIRFDPRRPPRTRPNVPHSPRTSPPWRMCTSPTGSAWCTANRPACTTSQRCCPAPSVAWCRKKWKRCGTPPKTRTAPTWWCSVVPRSPTSSV